MFGIYEIILEWNNHICPVQVLQSSELQNKITLTSQGFHYSIILVTCWQVLSPPHVASFILSIVECPKSWTFVKKITSFYFCYFCSQRQNGQGNCSFHCCFLLVLDLHLIKKAEQSVKNVDLTEKDFWVYFNYVQTYTGRIQPRNFGLKDLHKQWLLQMNTAITTLCTCLMRQRKMNCRK